jgi:hypothetical protein
LSYIFLARGKKPKQPITVPGEVTDSALSDNGWLKCKSNDKYKVKRYGNPMQCVGATFTVDSRHRKKFQYWDIIQTGRIESVVRRKNSSVPWFRFYDFDEFGDDIPDREFQFLYVECSKMLSTDSSVTGMRWTSRNGTNKDKVKKSKSAKKYFEMQYGLGNEKIYDQMDALDELRASKRKLRKNAEVKIVQSSESSESSVASHSSNDSEFDEASFSIHDEDSDDVSSEDCGNNKKDTDELIDIASTR